MYCITFIDISNMMMTMLRSSEYFLYSRNILLKKLKITLQTKYYYISRNKNVKILEYIFSASGLNIRTNKKQ